MILVVLTALTALVACMDRAVSNTATDGAATVVIDQRFARGREIYNYRCYFCHGYAGDAKTVAAGQLSPPPRDFHTATAATLPHAAIMSAVAMGRPGTAMKSFAAVLNTADTDAVAHFVSEAFVVNKRTNTHYHTSENGWDDHQRYAAAFPFARGELPVDGSVEQLNESEIRGRELFLRACITCHEPNAKKRSSNAWQIYPVSYPPDSYLLTEYGVVPPSSSIDPHHAHERAPKLTGASAATLRGESLFQKNCAHCHAADGSGRNWIGSFLEPQPPSLHLRDGKHRGREALVTVIRDGIPDSAMPAWRNVLASAEINAIAAYVERAFPMP